MPRSITLAWLLMVWFSTNGFAAAPRFETDVRAIFKQHCFHCHGEEEEVEGGLDVRLVRWIKEGGDSGPALVDGDPEESLLYQRVAAGEMPPEEGKQLSAEELATIRAWIADGAQTVRPEPENLDEGYLITEEERSHWSFQPIERPEVPQVQAGDRVANPIDAFLLAKLEAEGFSFSPRARPETLVRRLYFDLHGLPPTPKAAAEYAAKDSPQAWRDLIDQLLASPHYGERWARHWLDVAGYADSEGYNEADAVRPHAWRYRDYVIRALNDDMPYDQFIRQQLAGDEMVTSPRDNLTPEDAQLLVATGFLRMASDGTGGAVDDVNVARNETIADTIDIASSSLLGLTVACAQCHDHRYDPISHADYFRFRAIFEPALDWQKWRRPQERLVSLYTQEDREVAAKIEAEAKKLDAARAEKQKEFIQATFEKQLAELPEEIHEAAREAHATPANKRTAEQKALFQKHPNLNVSAGSLYLYDRKAADELKAMAEEAQKVRATKPPEEFVRALTEVPGHVPVTRLFYRGDHSQLKQELTPGGLSVIQQTTGLGEIAVNSTELPTTGRRLALAEQLTDPKHPLPARVIVNRIWMHHFGVGLVPTPNDFGFLGQPPTHPELLDWLASELIENGWSLKHIHRLILSSEAWQQQVRNNPSLEQRDPENQWYGGARLKRLDAEVVRDSILAISGKLNTKMYGPAIPVMADTAGRIVIGKENLIDGRPGKVIDMEGEDLRRSIYVQVRRSRPLSMLETFDLPVMSPNCDRRRPSTSATQSLLMLNSDHLIDQSRHVADRLVSQAPEGVEQQVRLAWQLIYARPVDDFEFHSARAFVEEQAKVFAAQPEYQAQGDKPPARTAEQEALAVLCQTLLSSNEFLYVE